MYSNYKHHVTYKALLGIAPSGAITFISELYEGSTSDEEIVKRSGILNKNIWDDNDSIMADRRFTIQNELAPLNVELNIPSFFGGKAQLTEAEVKESQTISFVRIHVERAITRIKKFKALNGSVNHMVLKVPLLAEFMSNIQQNVFFQDWFSVSLCVGTLSLIIAFCHWFGMQQIHLENQLTKTGMVVLLN